MLNPFANIFTNQAPVQTPPAAAPAPTTPPVADPTKPAAKLDNQVPSTEPVQNTVTAPNGVVPDNVPAAEKNPLDQFNTLWDTDPNAPAPAGNYTPEVLDAAKLQEVIAKTDMTSVLTPELQAKINAGGEEAQGAMIEAMNLVAQQTLMQSTTVANKMMESNSTKLMDAMIAKLPDLVKAQSVNNTLVEQNPIFSNPAVKPIMDASKTQLQLKFPNATPTEITKMTQDYIMAMGQAFNPATPPADIPGDQDWSNFESQG